MFNIASFHFPKVSVYCLYLTSANILLSNVPPPGKLFGSKCPVEGPKTCQIPVKCTGKWVDLELTELNTPQRNIIWALNLRFNIVLWIYFLFKFNFPLITSSALRIYSEHLTVYTELTWFVLIHLLSFNFMSQLFFFVTSLVFVHFLQIPSKKKKITKSVYQLDSYVTVQ